MVGISLRLLLPLRRAGVINTVTFGMFSGRSAGQQQGAGGDAPNAEDVADEASDAAQQTVDSTKVLRLGLACISRQDV